MSKVRYKSSSKTELNLLYKHHLNKVKVCWRIAGLSIGDYTRCFNPPTTNVMLDMVQLGGIQCSCISLMSIAWTLFGSPGLWNKSDLYSILGKRDQMSKLIGKFRYLGMEKLQQKFFLENLCK